MIGLLPGGSKDDDDWLAQACSFRRNGYVIPAAEVSSDYVLQLEKPIPVEGGVWAVSVWFSPELSKKPEGERAVLLADDDGGAHFVISAEGKLGYELSSDPPRYCDFD
eukprot:7265749-Prymnesium_polylepis.1